MNIYVNPIRVDITFTTPRVVTVNGKLLTTIHRDQWLTAPLEMSLAFKIWLLEFCLENKLEKVSFFGRDITKKELLT